MRTAVLVLLLALCGCPTRVEQREQQSARFVEYTHMARQGGSCFLVSDLDVTKFTWMPCPAEGSPQ